MKSNYYILTISDSFHGFSIIFFKIYSRFSFLFFFSVKWQKVVVVAVLGMGHIPGIVANWEKDINIRPLYE